MPTIRPSSPSFVIAAIVSTLMAWSAPVVAADSGSFQEIVAPLLAKHCYACHGPDEQKADIRLDDLSYDLLGDSAAAETWHDVLGVINRGEMPPDDAPQPSDSDRRKLVEHLTGAIQRVIEARRSTGGRGVLRRLNRIEYQNTMRDLLGIDTDYIRNLPPDSVSVDGFKNNGSVLQLSALQLEYYLQAARDGLAKAIVEGPAPEVFQHVILEGTEDGGRTVKELGRSNTLGRTEIFLAKIAEDYPEQGDFLLRVRARAQLKPEHGYPRLEVALGFRADTQLPHRVAGVVDITSQQWRDYEIRGRIEDFPLPSRTQSKFPGLLIKIANLYDDGSPLPKQVTVEVPIKGKKRTKKQKVWPDEPGMPKLEIESVEFVGPVFESWPPRHHTDILFASPVREQNERAYVAAVLDRFLRRAYRRPVSAEEAEPFLVFFDRARETLPSFEAAVRETLAMVLISPDFLYLMEPAGRNKRELDQWEIASRLSYFLWSTMPDEGLLEAAQRGELNVDGKLGAIAEEMIADSRSWQLVDQFVDQWLDVSAVDRVAVNPEFYPSWDNDLKASISEEPKQFFAEVLRQRLSALNFLDSDFAMLNGPLARHYGLRSQASDQDRFGMSFQRVELPDDSHRGGVLAQASFLLGNSTGEDSHPVKRAVWIRERLLDDPPADPPPNVPALDAENPDFAKLPVRKQLELHRQEASCNDCHRSIDPWGIALEEFGADGLFRSDIPRRVVVRGKRRNRTEMDRQPVESRTALPDGSEVSGLDDLKHYLLESQREPFARALVTKLLTYAVGRTLELSDQETIDDLTADFVAHDYQLHHLVESIVMSEPFLTK